MGCPKIADCSASVKDQALAIPTNASRAGRTKRRSSIANGVLKFWPWQRIANSTRPTSNPPPPEHQYPNGHNDLVPQSSCRPLISALSRIGLPFRTCPYLHSDTLGICAELPPALLRQRPFESQQTELFQTGSRSTSTRKSTSRRTFNGSCLRVGYTAKMPSSRARKSGMSSTRAPLRRSS